jgi:S-formylglutathione hydrolase
MASRYLLCPGGVNIKGEDDSYDFGSGAGFYVDATAPPWSNNYKMYSYLTSELPQTVFSAFPQIDSSRVSISGHSMGGHGALSLFLKNPGMYRSCSAFAPIANPLKAPWGEKAFKGYFGETDWETKGAEYDSTELVKKWKGSSLDLLIDVVCLIPHMLLQPLIFHRGLETTFTSKDSCCRKILPTQPRKPELIRASISDSNPIMTTATSPWQALLMTTWIMRQSICLSSR